MNPNLNKTSSDDSSRGASEAVYEQLSDYLFDKVLLLTNSSLSVSGATTSTTLYNPTLRVPDTSGGKFVRPDRKSRFRTAFYVTGGAENADFYILSPCVYLEDSISNFSSMSIFDSYVGIRCNNGRVYLVSKSKKNNGKETPTGIIITADTTNSIDILYSITSADIFINSEFVGTVESDMINSIYKLVTTYPVIAPIKSTNGTSVNLNFENYQFLQDR